MRHDAHAAHAQQRGAAEALVVEAPPDPIKPRPQREQCERCYRSLVEVLANRAKDVGRQSLEELEDDIPHEAIAHHHIRAVRDQLVALDVADEVQA